MRSIILCGILAATVGCAVEPVRHVTTDNNEVSSSIVAHIDGKYVLYRVNTGNSIVYFVDRIEGGTMTTHWLERRTRGRSRAMDVTTLGE